MKTKLFDKRIASTPDDALDFIGNMLESSTEYSIIAKSLDGTILLWNEGARLIYGYEPEEVVGIMNSSVLHTPEDVNTKLPEQILSLAIETGKWEGNLNRIRKDGTRFIARVVITPRKDSSGKEIGYLLISKDISHEIRLTEELKATQLYTRSLIESNIDALMTTDPLGIISDVNKQMEVLTNYTREELIGKPFKNYFTEPKRAEEGIKLVLKEGKVTNYELAVISKDNKITLVSYNASTFHDSQGKLHGVFAAARDITEQKKLEQQLRESQAYNRGLIESSIDALITVDMKGLINDVNARMCQMSGYTREDLIGTPFNDYFVDSDKAQEGVRQTLEKSEVTDYVLTLQTKKNEKIRVSFNATVFRDNFGEVRGIFASARDITHQEKLQSQLAEERTYNRGLIEASLDGLITVDPMLNITDVNETMCKMAGFTRAQLIGTPFPKYFTDSKRAGVGVRLTFDKGAVTNYELTLRSKDGVEKLVSFNAAIFSDEFGTVKGIFASARDITEQAKLQIQLNDERTYNRGLIEASVDGLVTVAENMLITDVNDTMCRMAGRNRNQLIGSFFPTYFKEQEQAEEGVNLTFKEGAVTNYVLTLISGEGKQIPVSFNAAVFRNNNGIVRGIFASARDITSQKQLEEKLQASQFYTRSLIESNKDALMTTDSLGIITDVNNQMEALTGFSREELIGSPFKGYFTDPQLAEEGVKQVLRDGAVANYELTSKDRNGKDTVVSYNAVTFNDRDGKLQGVFAAARDITEQKKLEQQLRESQDYNRGLIEASVDGLITVDSMGVISDMNDKMCQMTGYTRAELMGTPFADYFTETERAKEGVKETFDKGVVTEYALTLISRTRRLLQVSFNASIFLDSSSKVQGIFASARDITDRVRLEEQLRESQSYNRGLIEASVDGLITVDPEGFISDVNEQMCRITAYKREELIGSQFKQYFTQQELADIGVKKTFAEGFVTNYELVLKTKSGHKTTVSFNASVFRNSEGIIQGIFASARDISEQSKLQIQLAEQQAYNRSLIEASADALFAIASDGIITDVNEEAIRLTGYSKKQLLNSMFSDYFTEPLTAKIGVKKTLEDMRVIGYELILITRLGRRIFVSFNAGVFNDAQDHPLGILAAARDSTEQKKLELQLREQQFYTRSLIESNIDALMTTDSLGILSDVNEQMEQLTGCNRDELIGTPFKSYFTDPVRAENGIRLVLKESKVTDYELTARNKGGMETVVSYNATTFYDRDGKLQGVFAAARDVTERKRFEQTLQEANRLKSEFLANMSHELRSPLNGVIGFSEFLIDKKVGPLNEKQEEYLHDILNSGMHLLRLINDVLDLAKVEAGKMELMTETFEVRGAIEEVCSVVNSVATKKGIKITNDIAKDVKEISIDKHKFKQILYNLLSNAVKFTNEDGEVNILTKSKDKNYLSIQVKDNGVGISEEGLKRLFIPFVQLDSSISKQHEGTGLGLALTKKIVELHNGHITAESELNCGSTFTVTLPKNVYTN
ncbi:PAS domain S-box-containing protein [Chitinophaga sp. CF118]|uniref:PAS domain-containing protein n=1 Tax=Chitinophaga sp. CF118 TaxID=1884367 RepID=UPI0008E387DF|nr:PAS domain-containing protein [Chitinophaga sp. CF118]SFD82506.1 PAS domain S-box-containing protein [Chitinophaga sp. CF118]